MKSSCSYYDFGRCSSTARNRCEMYVFFGLFFQKTHPEKVLQVADSVSSYIDFSTVSFTGKELDEETGFGYFGARYYDPTLLTGWTAVDPMADKYPSLSPYNYCAWNPMKLVDPDGKEIYVGGLSDEMQKRLCSCLGIITGLELSVNESGLLVSSGTRNDKKKFSKTAQSDLLEAINDKTKRVSVTTNDHSGAETENIFSSKYTGKFWVWDGFDEKNRCIILWFRNDISSRISPCVFW